MRINSITQNGDAVKFEVNFFTSADVEEIEPFNEEVVMKNSADDRAKKNKAAKVALDSFWRQFEKKYPTEKIAARALFKRCVKSKARCCKRPRLKINDAERSAKCDNCHKEVWFTAGTVFEKIKHCRIWLAAVFCFERRIKTNPAAFAKRIGCAPSTAWEIFHKLRMVMNRHIQPGALYIDSLFFADAITKRSRETPARKHPNSEISSLRKAQMKALREAARKQEIEIKNAIKSLSPEGRRIYDVLGPAPIHIDLIAQSTGLSIGILTATLVELEICGLAKSTGSRYARTMPNSAQKPLQSAKPPRKKAQERNKGIDDVTTVQSIVNYFCEEFHGISRKYLQLYATGFWNMADPKRWWRGKLFRACVNTESIDRQSILEFVSDLCILVPYLVRV